jgi:predicted O-methyltransferase YrrM
MDEVDRLLEHVKEELSGMLSAAAYRRLFETAAASGGGAFIEIGTAQGAATAALALGALSSGRDFRIWTVDDFVSGSRPIGSSPEEKLAIVRRGFERFGVADRIVNVVGSTADLPDEIGLPLVNLLLIDADGRIDRDLASLHSRLAPGCPVIVDDMEDEIFLHLLRKRLQLDQKHRLTHRLLASYVEAGLLEADSPTHATGWFRKGPVSLPAAEIERLALPAYRQLVFAPLREVKLGLKWSLLRWLQARMPGLDRARRRLRGRKSGS